MAAGPGDTRAPGSRGATARTCPARRRSHRARPDPAHVQRQDRPVRLPAALPGRRFRPTMRRDAMNPEALRSLLTSWVAERCGLPLADIDPDRPLVEFGLSSVEAVELAGRLDETLDRQLGPTLVWEYPTINALVAGLTAAESSPLPTVPATETDAIAVVGLGCRLPGGINGPEALWEALLERRDAVGTVPAGRWATASANRFGG